MIKTYVLDTNILESTEGRAIFGFEDNEVIITHTTQEELDKHKEIKGELGYQARQTIKLIENILDNKQPDESVLKGIKLENGGTFRIVTNYLQTTMPVGWSLERADNRILCTTKTLSDQGSGKQVILITNDVSLKTKAIAMDIPVQKYQNDQLVTDEFYSGRTTIQVTDTCISKIFEKKELKISALSNKNRTDSFLVEEGDKVLFDRLLENEFVILEGITGGSALAWRKGDYLRLISSEDDKPIFGVKARNVGQKFAMEALHAPVEDIPLVIMKGPAGCGKTLLAMAVGLYYTYDGKDSRTFDSVVITRSNTLTDEDLGFLPGDLEEKMAPLLAPFFDNLKFLLGHRGEEKAQINLQIEDMLDTGVIEITSLSYIRGRSLRNTFLIVDEAQNLTRLQAKTIATRIGQGSKLIIAGDPNQIDNPKLDKKNNGLIYLSEEFKGSPLCAQIEFQNNECVRSKLATEAINRLK